MLEYGRARLFAIIVEVADLFWSWRLYLSVIPAILLVCLLHDKWPEAPWLWVLTVPSAVCALVVGIRSDYRSS